MNSDKQQKILCWVGPKYYLIGAYLYPQII